MCVGDMKNLKCNNKYLLSNIVGLEYEEIHIAGRINYINFFASYDGKWLGYNFRKTEKRHISYGYPNIVHYDFCYCYNKIVCLSKIYEKLSKVRKKLKHDIYTPRQMKLKRKEKTFHKIVYYVCG